MANLARRPYDAKAESIIGATARFYALSPEALKSRSHSRTIVAARHAAIYLIKADVGYSFARIAKIFRKNHSTVLYSHRKISAAITKSLSFHAKLMNIRTLYP